MVRPIGVCKGMAFGVSITNRPQRLALEQAGVVLDELDDSWHVRPEESESIILGHSHLLLAILLSPDLIVDVLALLRRALKNANDALARATALHRQ